MDSDHLILVQGWARDGLTEEQIAHNIGISASTLREWKGRFPAFSAAIKKGKEVVDYAVENALLKRALGGDTGAICFWLKNRRPDKWRDKPEYIGESASLVMAKEILDGVDSVID